MTTAEIALLISGFSAGIALLALGWNIYRDIILRPKVRLQISEILTPGDPREDPPRAPASHPFKGLIRA